MLEAFTKFYEGLPLCIVNIVIQNSTTVVLVEYTHQHVNVLVYLHLKNLVGLVLEEGTRVPSSIATQLDKVFPDLLPKCCSVLIHANSGTCHHNDICQSKHHIFSTPEVWLAFCTGHWLEEERKQPSIIISRWWIHDTIKNERRPRRRNNERKKQTSKQDSCTCS